MGGVYIDYTCYCCPAVSVRVMTVVWRCLAPEGGVRQIMTAGALETHAQLFCNRLHRLDRRSACHVLRHYATIRIVYRLLFRDMHRLFWHILSSEHLLLCPILC